MMEPELYLQSTYAQQCWALWSFWFQVQLSCFTERSAWASRLCGSRKVPTPLIGVWLLLSVLSLIQMQKRPWWSSVLLVRAALMWVSKGFPSPFLSGRQDRCHRDVWWEALSAQVQVTQEAVLLIDSRFGFFKKNNGVHVLEATDLCQVTKNVFNCMTVPVATDYLSVVCQLAYLYFLNRC